MRTATVEEVQVDLPALIAKLHPGKELIILRDGQPIARLTAEPPKRTGKRRLGSAVGILKIIEDDDAHLEDFREYLP